MQDLSLDKVKKIFFKILKWAGIILIVLVIFFIIFRIGSFIKGALYPPAIPPATVEYGSLPPIFFSSGIKKDFKYTIDTLSGELPTFTDKVNVYKVEVQDPDILAVDKTNSNVRSIGFDIGPEQLSETVYRWKSDDSLNKNLVVSVKIPEFNLSSTFLTNPSILGAGSVPTEAEAITIAKNFINALSFYPEDINDEKTLTKLLTINNGVIEEATSFSKTKLINVNFFQKDIDGLPIVYPQAGLSPMSITVGSGERNSEVIDARFFYQKPSAESATYPIKSSEEAYEDLKTGNAFIVAHSGKDLDIFIKDVYLAYYIEGRQQQFLTPVVVFEGDNGFFAYVSAVRDEWVDK